MTARISFLPVDNGDMTLIRFADDPSTTLLIDIRIRASADKASEETRDVANDLKNRLNTDDNNRPYVDAFLLTHPDQDHCLGLQNHFWLGSYDDYPDDKKPQTEKRIIIREMWSSPMIFRRKSKNHTLCADALAWKQEARRRVNKWKKDGYFSECERIKVLGEDVNGKTDDLEAILVKTGESFNSINGEETSLFSAFLIAPSAPQDEETETSLSKNESSTIISFTIAADKNGLSNYKFLSGGDAGVLIWERIWDKYAHNPEPLEYDIMLSPHHCSWRSLSWDSWSDYKENAKVSDKAKKALGQAKMNAFIISSSKAIEDNEDNPPCIRAKIEYNSILRGKNGMFMCTGETPSQDSPKPLEFEISWSGIKRIIVRTATATTAASLLGAAAPRAGASND
ncbi:metallohydrolase [Klebsiella variicola]